MVLLLLVVVVMVVLMLLVRLMRSLGLIVALRNDPGLLLLSMGRGELEKKKQILLIRRGELQRTGGEHVW